MASSGSVMFAAACDQNCVSNPAATIAQASASRTAKFGRTLSLIIGRVRETPFQRWPISVEFLLTLSTPAALQGKRGVNDQGVSIVQTARLGDAISGHAVPRGS